MGASARISTGTRGAASGEVWDAAPSRRRWRLSEGRWNRLGAAIFGSSAEPAFAVAIVAGLVLRVGWNLIAPVSPVSDYLWYFERAMGLAGGSGYITPEGLPTAYFPVGYSAFLAALFVPFGPSLAAAKTANIILSVATIWVAYLLFKRMLATDASRTKRVVQVAVFLLAFFPSQILYTALVSDSVLFEFLLCSGILVLMPATPGLGRLAGGGALFGLAALTRPYAILVPGVLMVFRTGGSGFADRMRRLALVYAAVIVVLAPWAVRNARSLGGFVPVSSNGGINFLIGNGPGATGAFTEAPLARVKEAGLSEREADRLAWRLGVEAVITSPFRFLSLAPKKVFYMYADDAQALRWNLKGMRARDAPVRYSPLELAGMGVVQLYYTVVVLASIAFAVLAIRRRLFRREVSAIGYWILLAFACTAILFFGDPRYHFPVTPFLCFYAACFWEAVRHRPALAAALAPATEPWHRQARGARSGGHDASAGWNPRQKLL